MKALAKCDYCGKRFGFGNTNGMPNGVSMMDEDGKMTTICQRCIIELGQMDDEQKKAFFKKLDGDKN